MQKNTLEKETKFQLFIDIVPHYKKKIINEIYHFGILIIKQKGRVEKEKNEEMKVIDSSIVKGLQEFDKYLKVLNPFDVKIYMEDFWNYAKT